MAKSASQVSAAAPANRRLTMIILIGLGLAVLVVLYVLFFTPKPQAPKLAIYPGAQVIKTADNGDSFEVHMQTQGPTLKQISVFYQHEFTSTGWIVLNDKVASTPDHLTVVYESQDQLWGVTLDVDYQADRGVALIDLYEQKL